MFKKVGFSFILTLSASLRTVRSFYSKSVFFLFFCLGIYFMWSGFLLWSWLRFNFSLHRPARDKNDSMLPNIRIYNCDLYICSLSCIAVLLVWKATAIYTVNDVKTWNCYNKFSFISGLIQGVNLMHIPMKLGFKLFVFRYLTIQTESWRVCFLQLSLYYRHVKAQSIILEHVLHTHVIS